MSRWEKRVAPRCDEAYLELDGSYAEKIIPGSLSPIRAPPQTPPQHPDPASRFPPIFHLALPGTDAAVYIPPI